MMRVCDWPKAKRNHARLTANLMQYLGLVYLSVTYSLQYVQYALPEDGHLMEEYVDFFLLMMNYKKILKFISI